MPHDTDESKPPDVREGAVRPQSSKDWQALRRTGESAGASRSIGGAFCWARDHVARFLIRLGATPDRVTWLGFLFTCAAGYCLARGASEQVPYFAFHQGAAGWWPALAAVGLILAGACDMLDGAVARVSGTGSRAGGLLDSTVDRFSDMAIFIGCMLHFVLREPSHLTYVVLAVVGLCNAVLISYVKARAENMIKDCSVGFWLRGERIAAVLIGCMTGHVTAVLWQLALSGALTVVRRVRHALGTLRAIDAGLEPPSTGPSPRWWGRLQIWCHPRGSVPYDIGVGLQILFIIVAPWLSPIFRDGATADVLRRWFVG